MSPLYSVGHSNAELTTFVELLKRHGIARLVDTRSQPYSRYSSQFNRESLKKSLADCGIEYIYLGDLIGGRPEGEQYYFSNGKVDYQAVAEAPFYLDGIDRLTELGRTGSAAFMCSEADYHECHRYKLITRTLLERGVPVYHILHNGEAVRSEISEFVPSQMSLF